MFDRRGLTFFASWRGFFCSKDNNKVSFSFHSEITPQVPPTYIFENGEKDLVKYFDLLKLPNEKCLGKSRQIHLSMSKEKDRKKGQIVR